MKTLYWLPRIFAAIGSALLLATAWMWSKESGFAGRAARATGTVISLDYQRDSEGSGTYHPVFQFQTEGGQTITHVGNTGCRPSCYEVGERVQVLYDPADPNHATTATFFGQHVGSFVFGLLAAIFGGIGFIWLYVVRRNAERDEELRRTGKRLDVKVVEVERRLNMQVNGRNPWRIVAQWQDPGTQVVHVFRSANIWFDPAEWVKETVPVFMDRNDPKRYVMDISFLPQADT